MTTHADRFALVQIDPPYQTEACTYCFTPCFVVYNAAVRKSELIDADPAHGGAVPTETLPGFGIRHTPNCKPRQLMNTMPPKPSIKE